MTFSIDEFVDSVLLKDVQFCRLCLRTESERRLLYSPSYSVVLLRYVKVKYSQQTIAEQMLCYVCDAMMQRTIQVLDMVTASQAFVLPNREPLDKNGLRRLAHPFRTKFIKSVELCRKRSKLCITETLNIDSNEKTTIDLTDDTPALPATPVTAPALKPTAATPAPFKPAVGGNIILMPSVGAGNVFQLPGNSFQLQGNTFQLPGNTFQLPGSTFQLPANTFQLLNGGDPAKGNGTQQWQLIQVVNDLPTIAPPPTPQQPPPPPPTPPPPPKPPTPPAPIARAPTVAPGRGFKVPVTESGTSGSGSQLFRVEDSDCVAFIETNISEEMRLAGAGASEGLCVVPDSYVYLSDDSDPESGDGGGSAVRLSGPVTSTAPMHEPEGELLVTALERPVATTRELQRIVAKDIKELTAPPKQVQEKVLQPAASLGNFTTSQRQLGANGLSDAMVKAARYRSGMRKVEDRPMARTPETDASLLAQMRESREPATRPAVYGQPIRPVPRDREVDWEDRIPVEVITYADEAPPPQRAQLGVISDVYSQAPPPRAPAPHQPAPHRPAAAAREPRKRLKLS